MSENKKPGLAETYRYGLSEGWVTIKHPFIEKYNQDNYERMIQDEGYALADQFDPGICLLSVYHNIRGNAEYYFYFELGVGDDICSVFIRDYPSAIEFLNKVSVYPLLSMFGSVYDATKSTRWDEQRKTDYLDAERRRSRGIVKKAEK